LGHLANNSTLSGVEKSRGESLKGVLGGRLKLLKGVLSKMNWLDDESQNYRANTLRKVKITTMANIIGIGVD
jgi:hypothetical protein